MTTTTTTTMSVNCSAVRVYINAWRILLNLNAVERKQCACSQ